MHLLDRGFRVSVVCQPGTPLMGRCSQVAHSHFAVYPLCMTRSFCPLTIGRAFGLLGKICPDLVHTHSSVDSWVFSLAGRMKGIPLVRSRHVSLPVRDFFPNNLIYSRFPDRIITSGKSISEVITRVRGVDPGKVVSISAGVDLNRFHPGVSGASVRKELGIGPDVPLIGKIGVVRGWKGHDYLLEAVPRVLQRFPDARFVCAGTGPGFEEVKRKAQAKGLEDKITLLGHREDVPELMAACNVIVLASIAGEGTPQVIPQSFAMKTPMVATRIGSTPELLGEGERGVLVEPRSGESLAQGIVRLLDDPGLAERLAENAFDYCRKEMSIGKMIDQTIAVYDAVLHRPLGKGEAGVSPEIK